MGGGGDVCAARRRPWRSSSIEWFLHLVVMIEVELLRPVLLLLVLVLWCWDATVDEEWDKRGGYEGLLIDYERRSTMFAVGLMLRVSYF